MTGVTTMRMDEGIDTGDMLLKVEVPIESDETGGTLRDKLSKAGADLLIKTLKELQEGNLIPQKQEESPTLYAKMIYKEQGNIDWNRPAAEIERTVRGFDPWPGTYTYWNGNMLKIWKATVEKEEKKDSIKYTPGTVLRVEKDCFSVQTGDGVLKVKEVQLAGKKRMETSAFLRGNILEAGTLLKRTNDSVN